MTLCRRHLKVLPRLIFICFDAVAVLAHEPVLILRFPVPEVRTSLENACGFGSIPLDVGSVQKAHSVPVHALQVPALGSLLEVMAGELAVTRCAPPVHEDVGELVLGARVPVVGRHLEVAFCGCSIDDVSAALEENGGVDELGFGVSFVGGCFDGVLALDPVKVAWVALGFGDLVDWRVPAWCDGSWGWL